jgi:hypothetical protein
MSDSPSTRARPSSTGREPEQSSGDKILTFLGVVCALVIAVAIAWAIVVIWW